MLAWTMVVALVAGVFAVPGMLVSLGRWRWAARTRGLQACLASGRTEP